MGIALDHVLIVDPTEAVRATVKDMLSQAMVPPILISEATSAADALAAYQAPSDLRPTIILLALDLCGQRGDEWLTEVRGSSKLLTTPIVVLGNDDEDRRIEVALGAGANEWLLFSSLKPHSLKRTLESVLSRHQLYVQSAEMEQEFHTERKAADEDSRLNEERLRVVLNGSPITMMTVDRDLRYLWVHNPQGFTAEEMLHRRDDELFPPEIARPYLEFKREALAKGTPVRRELEFLNNGTIEKYDSRAEPLHDTEGNIIGLTIVSINITERVRGDERTSFLAEASQVLSTSLDYETTLQRVAAAVVPKLADWCSVDILSEEQEILQVAVAHVDPNKVKWAKGLRAENPPSMDDPGGLALVLRTGKSEFYPNIPAELMEEALRRAETEEQREIIRSVGFKSVMIVPLLTRNKILGAITLVWSDSDRHYDEADLVFAEELALRAATAVDHARLYRESLLRAEDFRLLSETLELQVDERTRELQRSNQDLDQFAYIASHDLKAPLRAIDHLSTWVMEDVGHLLPDRSREHLLKMRSRIKRMEGLLDDLLTYSRAGRFRGEASLVNTNELVARVIDTVSPPDNFTVVVEGEMPTLFTYAAPLETVLRNLVNNAIKHHDKPTGNVRIWVTEKDGWVEFAVADDGPGIDPAFHDRIFQMFQTLRPRDQVEGSGIGLAVVDKIILNVGGTITVDSVPGQGSTFRFTWPRESDS